MKKTAVEWLYNKFSTCTSDELVGNINNWFEQAKAMEKEQIERAYKMGRYESDTVVMSDKFYAEQYYNETFKTK